MSYRILLATGGTGGHVFPAIAVAEALLQRHPDAQLLFAGGGLGSNRFLVRSCFVGKEISCGSFSSKNPLSFLHSLSKIACGCFQSSRLLNHFSPELLIAFGSYYTFPLLCAAIGKGIPLLVHEANSIAGRVNRLAARYADLTAIYFPLTCSSLVGKVVLAQMPLRSAYVFSAQKKQQAYEYFGFDPKRLTLLIFGGSQGARALNALFMEIPIAYWAVFSSAIQILHFTGNEGDARQLHVRYCSAGISAVVKPFESHMDRAWHAADLAICRAGASTIAEALAFRVPMLFIPYPYATDDHQRHNAQFVVEQIRAGHMLGETAATAEVLVDFLQQLLAGEAAVLRRWQRAIEQHMEEEKRRPDLASLAIELIEQKRQKN